MQAQAGLATRAAGPLQGEVECGGGGGGPVYEQRGADAGRKENMPPDSPSSPPLTAAKPLVVPPVHTLPEASHYTAHAVANDHDQNDTRRARSFLPPSTVAFLKQWMMSPQVRSCFHVARCSFSTARAISALAAPDRRPVPQHIQNPYPTEVEKQQIIEATGIQMKQLTNWFTNNRKRFWKPKMNRMNVR